MNEKQFHLDLPDPEEEDYDIGVQQEDRKDFRWCSGVLQPKGAYYGRVHKFRRG